MNDILILALFFGLYFSPVFYQLIIVLRERKRGNLAPLRRFKKILLYSFLVFTAIAVIFLVLNRINFLDYKSPMTYDKVDQITFEDFKGLEFFKKTLYGNERFAYIVTTIDSEIKDDYVRIESLFHPSRSFVYKQQIKSKELLTHEIYHFKITELFVRKAKQKILSQKPIGKEQIQKIISKMKLEVRKYQYKYDDDTFHSYVFSEQKRYENTVDSLLNLLSEFKDPKIILNE